MGDDLDIFLRHCDDPSTIICIIRSSAPAPLLQNVTIKVRSIIPFVTKLAERSISYTSQPHSLPPRVLFRDCIGNIVQVLPDDWKHSFNIIPWPTNSPSISNTTQALPGIGIADDTAALRNTPSCPNSNDPMIPQRDASSNLSFDYSPAVVPYELGQSNRTATISTTTTTTTLPVVSPATPSNAPPTRPQNNAIPPSTPSPLTHGTTTLPTPSPTTEVEGVDVLAPRPPVVKDRFTHRPSIQYFCIPNEPGAREFEQIIDQLTTFLDAKAYSRVAVGVTHAGYEHRTAIPIVYVIAKGFRREDALWLTTEWFPSRELQILSRLVCYQGTARSQMAGDPFTLHERLDPVVMGSAISEAGGDTSFSSGIFIQTTEQPNETFMLSVHHGLTMDPTPIDSKAARTIIQPSQIDIDGTKRILLERYHNVLVDGPTPRRPEPAEYYKAEYDEFADADFDLGSAVHSMFTVTDYDNARVNIDIAVIQITTDRQVKNIIPYSKYHFGDEDWDGDFGPYKAGYIHISGEGILEKNKSILKSGMKTGTTSGRIELIYTRAKLTGIDEYTSEYTVVSRNPHSLFAKSGDSGAIVVNENGQVVGMVIGGDDGVPDVLEGYDHWGALNTTYITPFALIRREVESCIGPFTIL